MLGAGKRRISLRCRKTSLKRAKVSTFDVTVVPLHSIHVSSGTGASPRKLTRVTECISPARFAWDCMRAENSYAATGFVNRAFPIVVGQWLGRTSPRLTPTHLLQNEYLAVTTTTHHTYYTKRVKKEMEGPWPTFADKAHLPVEPTWHVDLLTLMQHQQQSLSSTIRQSTRVLSVTSRKSQGTSDTTVTTRCILSIWCWVTYRNKWINTYSTQAMVTNVASCRIVNTFLVAE